MNKYKIFTKTPWDKKAAIFYTLLLFLSIIYALFFDAPRVDATTYGKNATLLIVACASLCLPLFFLLMLSRWVFIVIAPLLFYIGAVSRVYAVNYLLNVTPNTAPLFFNNSVIGKFAENPENAAFLGGMFTLGLAAGFIRFFYAKDAYVIRKGQAFAIILILAAIGADFLRKNYPQFTPQPYAYVGAMQKYATEKVMNYFFYPKFIETTANKGDDVLGIIIFADKLSSDADYSGFETSEKFYVNKNFSPNFINFRHNFLSAFTGAGKNNPNGVTDGELLISILKKIGYPTEWVGLHNKFIIKNDFINRIAKKTVEKYSLKENFGYPNPLLAIENIDEFIKNNTKGFLVIFSEGTPPKIAERYGDFFLHGDKVVKDNVEKAYTQYIMQTKTFINEIKNRLEDKKAFIILAGLEGEEIIDYNDFKNTGKNVLPSVFALWVSPSLEKAIKHQDSITVDYLYHTVLGCAGITSPNLDNTKNLCEVWAKSP